MFRFMLQKLLHKKWMVICLLIGNILLVAIACSNPMYQNAALQKTLTSNFSDYIADENIYPGLFTLEAEMRSGNAEQGKAFEAMQKLSGRAADAVGFEQTDQVTFYALTKVRAQSLMNREDSQRARTIRICALTGLKNHVNMLSGQMCGNAPDASGAYEAVISQRALSKLNLVVGEEIEFSTFHDSKGEPVRVKITGVFENSEEEDPYWVTSPNDYFMECFIDSELFCQTFINTKKPAFSVTANWNLLFDYKTIAPGQVNRMISNTEKLIRNYTTKVTTVQQPGYLSVLKSYQVTSKKITTTLLILQIPVLALLLAFIFMISRQMLDLEQNEIAMLKSRGSSKGQILTIYLLQSSILSGVSLLIGLPLGIFLCKALGSTNGFLEFIQRKALHVSINFEVLLYALGAVTISVAFMVLPVFRDANVTIVNYKQKKNRKGKNLIHRAYLDVILLLVSLYGLYSFSDRTDALTAQMLQGGALDPFLFICSSLFIISASLVALRIQPLLVKLVYLVGKRAWKPTFFASFLQIIRTKGKQSFMMVFLMLTAVSYTHLDVYKRQALACWLIIYRPIISLLSRSYLLLPKITLMLPVT